MYSVSNIEKQSLKGVLVKRCSKNMQQINRKIPIRKYNFYRVSKQLYFGNHTSARVISCNFAAYVHNTFIYKHLWGSPSEHKKSKEQVRCINFKHQIVVNVFLSRRLSDDEKSWHELEVGTKSAWPCIAPLHRTGKCKSFLTENCSLDIQLYLCQLVLYCHLTLALLIYVILVWQSDVANQQTLNFGKCFH